MPRGAKIAIPLVIFLTSPAYGATYVVHPDGTGDTPDIQSAVDIAVNGDVVELTDGTFWGIGNRNVAIVGKSLTIQSASGDPSTCVIDGQSSQVSPARAFLIEDVASIGVTISGIGVENVGDPSLDGGAFSCARSSLTLADIRVNSPRAWLGGAIAATDSYIYAQGCHFSNADAYMGGAIWCLNTDLEVVDCEMRANRVPTQGAAISAEGGGLRIASSVVADHVINAVSARDCSAVDILDSEFLGNLQDGGTGGALRIYSSALTIKSSYFNENSAYDGGSLFADELPSLEISDCLFVGNTGNIFVNSATTAHITRSTFLYNHRNKDHGGAVTAWCDTPVVVEESLFARNSAEDGPAIRVYGSLTITGSTFAANDDERDSGVVSCTGQLTLDTCLFAENDSPAAHAPTAVATCTNIFGNLTDWGGPLAGLEGVSGNFSADPVFCDPAEGDFTLGETSPCLSGNHPDGLGCGQIGALGLGCKIPVPTLMTSWGRIKARYTSPE